VTISATSHGASHGPSPTLDELILAYWRHARRYYVKNGQPTGETDNIRASLRPLRRLYGSTEANRFGPDSLELVRQSMIDADLSRKVINARVRRIKRMFRWASKKRFVPPEMYNGLQAADGLLRGRSNARETESIKPIPEAQMNAVLPHVSPQVLAMIRVQELAGMRPQDIRNMRTCDVETAGDVCVDGGSKLRRGAAEDPPKSRFVSARVSGPKRNGGADSCLHACRAVHLLCTGLNNAAAGRSRAPSPPSTASRRPSAPAPRPEAPRSPAYASRCSRYSVSRTCYCCRR